MSNTYATSNEILDLRRQLHDQIFYKWLHVDLFSFNWWLSLVLTLLFWMVWFQQVDRRRLLEISFYGAMITIISIILDIIGVNLVLWSYGSLFEPLTPALIPGDLVMMPVMYSLLYQRYGKNWRAFLSASIVLSACVAFLVEPLLVWMGIYKLINWRFVYSFPIYILVSMFTRSFVHKVLCHQHSPPD
ncbi:CBO0543 family protein [Tumebacillus flagellatus]|uniref:Uncharacterized protein n=1 Tax=Tumebacillus flagellatus TaxID=1157490 RepID=A0A074LSV6_9BACL|nr:CBO0543 family protein [Tumebacillus flagellatus]KEO85241.1 hypothetical protein EL26_01400 [Tumebacillus flagellatus]